MKTLSISALVLLILALSNPVSVDASDAAARSTAQRFYRTYLKPNQLPLTVKIGHRKELQRSDFDAFDGKDTIDVRRFQRKVRSKINRATTSDCGGPLDWVNSRR
jgi:hypothetical protein